MRKGQLLITRTLLGHFHAEQHKAEAPPEDIHRLDEGESVWWGVGDGAVTQLPAFTLTFLHSFLARVAHSRMFNPLGALVGPVIEKTLGKFVKLDDGNKLDTSGGKIRLNRVELREDAFDDLGLPFALRGGMVEEVQVDIPWMKLKTDSVIIRLHQPILLFTPHSENEWDLMREQRRSAARKGRELQQLREAAAPVSADAAYAPVDNADKNGFLDKIIARVIDNVQLIITGAVVRLEDYSHAASPFGIELAFDSLWIHPEHVSAPEPGGGAGSTGSSKGAASEARPPLAHREALVCALCAYMLDASSLPAEAQLTPCGSAEALEVTRRASRLVASSFQQLLYFPC